ncbi:MAG: DNA cytosine methyltransferase [Candidatus Hydrogenedentes bacterium]|nr:DNA cytosine methyltransferase [Candidatus Hydrogenedentota bacterium]
MSLAQTAAISGPSKYRQLLADAWQAHLAPRAPDAPTVISTFAGCGGSSLGYSMAGYRELLAVEWSDHAAATLRANFPDLPVYHGDIAQLSVDYALGLAGLKPGELDVLDGSPPCQGFSTSGARILDDPRNQLFREYVRLLQGLRPKVFVMENVSGMVKGRMRLIFADIIRELRTCGYRVSARLMNAMYFRVPQSRQRMIFIGAREDLGLAPSHPRPLSMPYPVSMAIGDLGDVQDASTGHVWIDESPAGRNTKNWPLAHRARQGEVYAGQQRREVWTKPAFTLMAAAMIGKPYLRSRNCHPLYTRTYSLLEHKRLASIPDEFVFPGEPWAAFTRIGNCVPPLFMRAIARHIRETILKRISS